MSASATQGGHNQRPPLTSNNN